MSDIRKTLSLMMHIDRVGVNPMCKALTLIHLAIKERSYSMEIARKIGYSPRSVGRPISEMVQERLITSIDTNLHGANIRKHFILSERSKQLVFDSAKLNEEELEYSMVFISDLNKSGIKTVKQTIIIMALILSPGIGNEKLANLLDIDTDSMWGLMRRITEKNLIDVTHIEDPKSGLKRPYYRLSKMGENLFKNVIARL